jgi:hypothetical protein
VPDEIFATIFRHFPDPEAEQVKCSCGLNFPTVMSWCRDLADEIEIVIPEKARGSVVEVRRWRWSVAKEQKVINEDLALSNVSDGTIMAGLMAGLYGLIGIGLLFVSIPGAFAWAALVWAAFYAFAAWRIGHARSRFWAWVVWLAYFGTFLSVQFSPYKFNGEHPVWSYILFLVLVGSCYGAWHGVEGTTDLAELKNQRKAEKASGSAA